MTNSHLQTPPACQFSPFQHQIPSQGNLCVYCSQISNCLNEKSPLVSRERSFFKCFAVLPSVMFLANCWSFQEHISSVRRGWELLCQTLPPGDSHLTPAWLLCSKSQPLNVTACPECIIWVELNISRADKNLSARLIMHWLTAPRAVACPEGRQLCTEVTFLLSWPHLTKDGKCQRNRTVPVTLRGNFTSWLSVLEGAGIYRLEPKSLGGAWTHLPRCGRDVYAWQQWLCVTVRS